MDQKKIDISVITPFYKGNLFMEQLFTCVRKNALSASGLAIELILVNDSPDCPVCYREEWVEGFSLRVYCNPINVGIQRSRIHGLHQARGTFVVFLDQDDLLSDDALLSQYRFAQTADIVVSNGYNENRDTVAPIYCSVGHQKLVMSQRFYLSVGCMIVSPGQCLIRRDSIPALWKERFIECNGADDLFLWLLLLHETCRWEINPDVVYTHVDTGENLSANLERMLRSSSEVLDILLKEGKLTKRQKHTAERRFEMRRLYEGRKKWRKLAACIKYPDLFWELLVYTYLKKCFP